MEFLYEMLVVLEVILMNLCIFKKNAKNRYPFPVVLIILLLYTMLLIRIGVDVIQALGIYGNGNGLFTLFGFFYLFPLHYLYEGSPRKHFYIICFAWIYTLAVFIIAVQIGSMFTAYAVLAYNVLIIQTLMFLASYYFVDKFMNTIYIVLMHCHDESIQKKLNLTSLLWFMSIFFMNMHFIFENERILKIVAIVTFLLNAFYNFVLLYDILMKHDQIGYLQKEVSQDTLTGLGSRMFFHQVLKQKMEEGTPFYFVYLDLDDFKKVNDEYGHLVGDEYLKTFAQRIAQIAEQNMSFRISGDEFVVLIVEKDITIVMKELNSIDFILPSTDTTFRGVSYGVAHYPKDAQKQDCLISLADQRMYENKIHKKANH